MLSVLYSRQQGTVGRTCLYDCGPHASCRCGMCVSGGDKNACVLPHCAECDSSVFSAFVLFLSAFLIVVISCLYGALRVLRAMNYRSHRNCLNLSICDWFCLCDANLFSRPSTTLSSAKLRKRSYSLPPMVHFLLSVIVLVLLTEYFLLVFGDLIHDVFAIIPEELYPSDHLVLSATLELANKMTK